MHRPKGSSSVGGLPPAMKGGLASNSPFCLPTCQVMLPVVMGEQISSELLAATLAELDVTLQVLEDKFLQDKAFLVGPQISLADLVAITELMHVSVGCQLGTLYGWRSWPVAEVLFMLPHLAVELCLCVTLLLSAQVLKPGR